MGADCMLERRAAGRAPVSLDRLALTAAAIALYWAAILNVAYCPLLLPGGDASSGWHVWVFSTLAHGVAAAIALHAAANGTRCGEGVRAGRFGGDRAGMAAAALLTDAGMAALFFVPRPSLVAETVGAAAVGVGFALVFATWVQELVSLRDARLVWVLSGWSHLGGLLFAALTAALPCGLGRAATFALIPVAALCLVRARSLGGGAAEERDPDASSVLPALPGIPVDPVPRPAGGPRAPRAPAPLGMLLCCVLFCIPMGVFRSLDGDVAAAPGADWRAVLAQASLIVGTVMMVDLLSTRLRESRFYYRLIVPMLAGGVLVSALLAGDAQLSGSLIVAATALFLIYAYYALGCLYDGCDRASLAGITMVALALDFGMVGGALLGTALRATALPAVLELAMGVLYLALLVGMWAVPRAFEWLSGFDIIARSEGSPTQGGLAIAHSSAERTVPAELARAWGLSERERETAELIVRGHSVKSIAHELCVSENTVKTHRAHLYTKLGIHARDELIDLIERPGGGVL